MTGILIYGAGAIGSFLGYLLSEAPGEGASEEKSVESVALLGRAGHMNAIKERGMHVDLGEKREVLHFRHCFSSLDELKRSDFYPQVVVVCVKTHSLPALARELRESGLLEERLKEARFILLMNGMGNREALLNCGLDSPRLFEAITSFGVVLAGEGRIELKGRGKTVIQDGMGREEMDFLTERLSEKGFEIEFSRDFSRQQYQKLLVNAAINPITALTRRQNSIILSPVLKSTVERVVAEAVAVAAADGVAIQEMEAFNLVLSVAERTAANTSSMLQDVLRGRRTEIEAINGYIVRQGKKHGIAVPANEALYGMVKAAVD
ncbi:MAG TPA: 2-dehydropantoate 2-reductase [Methanothrix sp.]|nr:2-dehydropantoate 2-reductase [Methanothrix sp.]HQJ79052.1 2-dehydropantoate 2-reductase [Methanothrix sp.]